MSCINNGGTDKKKSEERGTLEKVNGIEWGCGRDRGMGVDEIQNKGDKEVEKREKRIKNEERSKQKPSRNFHDWPKCTEAGKENTVEPFFKSKSYVKQMKSKRGLVLGRAALTSPGIPP